MKEKIFALIENTLELEAGTINENTMIEDVKGWDSLAHVLIIGALESELNISIPLDEAVEMTSVAELLEKAGL
jgi:acyl carrier protein